MRILLDECLLCAKSNDITDLEPLMPAVLAALPNLKRGEVRRIKDFRE